MKSSSTSVPLGEALTVPNLRQLPWVQPVLSTPCHYASVLLELDKGEKHTLDMAQKFNADWVIIDEKIARNMAEYLGLSVTGILGILLNAKRKGWIRSFQACVAAMQNQGIRYHPQLVARLIQEAGEF